MDLRELKIGNVTNFGIVTEIRKDCFYVENDNWERFKSKWTKIEPIPLTEEWFKRAGFKRTNPDSTYPEFERKHLIVAIGNGDWCAKQYEMKEQVISIKYVHQLQNLYYCLTGEELELNR